MIRRFIYFKFMASVCDKAGKVIYHFMAILGVS